MKISDITQNFKKRECVHCGAMNDCLTEVGSKLQGTAPRPGDFTVCLTCVQLMVFDENLEPRDLTEEEKKIAAKIGLIEELRNKMRQIPGKRLC